MEDIYFILFLLGELSLTAFIFIEFQLTLDTKITRAEDRLKYKLTLSRPKDKRKTVYTVIKSCL